MSKNELIELVARCYPKARDLRVFGWCFERERPSAGLSGDGLAHALCHEVDKAFETGGDPKQLSAALLTLLDMQCDLQQTITTLRHYFCCQVAIEFWQWFGNSGRPAYQAALFDAWMTVTGDALRRHLAAGISAILAQKAPEDGTPYTPEMGVAVQLQLEELAGSVLAEAVVKEVGSAHEQVAGKSVSDQAVAKAG